MTTPRFKFRAWSIETKEMCDVSGWSDDMNGRKLFLYRHESGDNIEAYEIGLYDVSPRAMTQRLDYVLMQSTGLLDANGRELWEGDLLQESGHGDPLEIRWWADLMRFHCFRHSEGRSYPWEVFFDADSSGKLVDQTYLGNIYEHPELLERR